MVTEDGFGERSYVLYAGQNLDAGSVTIQITEQALLVDYQTTGLWTLSSVALWIGNTSNGYPQTKNGNPVPGKFPYKSGSLSNATTYRFAIPLHSLGFTCPAENAFYFMMAHADLRRVNYDGSVQTETGWSEGERVVEKGNWATRSTFELTCDCDDGGEGEEKVCETAFAWDPDKATCFSFYGFDRWGWTNGPYFLEEYTPADTLYLYAGAAQCDRSKGAEAGILTMSYTYGRATLLYNTLETGFVLQETHSYLGPDPIPFFRGTPTVAPGQFPYIHEELAETTQDTVQIPYMSSGASYLIGHAVVCK